MSNKADPHDNRRGHNPIAAVGVNWRQLLRLFHAASLLKLDAFRRKIFPAWGIDFEKIRAGGREATFSKKRIAEAVELGVKTARAWCGANGVPSEAS